MLKGFTELFIFTKGERNGAIVLTILILLLLGGRSAYKYYLDTKEYDYSEIEKQISELKIQEDSLKKVGQTKTKVKNISQDRYVIDPNKASLKDLVQLGLSEKQAKVILNYRSKGGRFHFAEDLLKIYSIDKALYAEIESFIRIENIEKFKKKSTERIKIPESKFERNESKPIALASINLNLSDTTELKSIKGIGSYYAKNIVKYREVLGGYHSSEQLNEVYGLRERPEAIESLLPYIKINPSDVITIDINTCTRDQLKSHPYIKWAVANSIVGIREMHGRYAAIEDVQKSAIIDKDLFLKLRPYLSVTPN